MTEEEFREKVEDQLYTKLLKEMFSIPEGWEEEVYCSSQGEISFSSPMTINSYTKSEDLIGRIQSFTISDLEEFSEYSIFEVDESHYAYENDDDYYSSPDNGEGVFDENLQKWVVSLQSVLENWDIEDMDFYQDLVNELIENAVKLYYPEAKANE